MKISRDGLRPEREAGVANSVEHPLENSSETRVQRNTAWFLVVVGLLLSAFFLGLPQVHYTVALMIAVILRYKDVPLNAPLFPLSPAPSASE